MSRVIGAGGRGVVVVTADPEEARRDVQRLEKAGVPATRPSDQGLVRCSPGEPSAWAVALRRPVLATVDGVEGWVAVDGSESERSAPGATELVDREPTPRVAVFGGAWIGPDEAEHGEAYRFGARCGEAGIEVVNGGYGGVMEAVSRGVTEAGGRAVGVTITSFSEVVAVSPALSHEVEAADLFARLPVICDAEAWVAFPGGVGTLSEVALCWNLVQTESLPPRPLVIVGERWDRALAAFRELLLAERLHFDLVRAAGSADAAFEGIRPALSR